MSEVKDRIAVRQFAVPIENLTTAPVTGYLGITEQQCAAKGCCWNPTDVRRFSSVSQYNMTLLDLCNIRRMVLGASMARQIMRTLSVSSINLALTVVRKKYTATVPYISVCTSSVGTKCVCVCVCV